ncbi:MAG: radical SAM protein [Candidatus Desantisbacteria bacterium]
MHLLPKLDNISSTKGGRSQESGVGREGTEAQRHRGTKEDRRQEEGIFGDDISPEEVIQEAIKHKCKSISYTYTEPTIFFEYAYEIAKLAKEKGIYNVFVTNGFMSKEAIEMIAPYLDAANIDLKSMEDEFYRNVCGGRLDVVLSSIKRMKELGIWVEVTTLIVTGFNESPDNLRNIASFLKGIGEEIPWHISRFYPSYKMDILPPTPISFIDRAIEIGKEVGLRYIYPGNIPKDPRENTYCWNCKGLLIKRMGFFVEKNSLKKNLCPDCGAKIDGVFLPRTS